MAGPNLKNLRAELGTIIPVRPVGRVCDIRPNTIKVTGLSRTASVGHRVGIGGNDGSDLFGEVVSLDGSKIVIMTEASPDAIKIGDRVHLLGKREIAPDESWIGRLLDPSGCPLDGRSLMRGEHPRSLTAQPPPPASRRMLGERLSTGLAVFDTMLPIVRGQRLGLFSGSGVGKSMLLSLLARGVAADIVVIALIGERGREVREFVENVLGSEGLARSVVITATSDKSPLERRRCAFTAMSVAEYFRDKGLHVLLLADSITRFAEAHREIASASGENSSLNGFPPSTSQMIMSLCERAGPGSESTGDITAIFTVLVAGSDMDGAIADILRGVLDGHVVLDRAIAERGRFPAVNLLRSVSRSLPKAANADENQLIVKARKLLSVYDRAELMIQAGLYSSGSDPLIDEAISVWSDLDAFLAEPSNTVAAGFERLEKCLNPNLQTIRGVAGSDLAVHG